MKAGVDASGCGAAQQGVNTSDGETWCGGGGGVGGEGRGWCEGEKEWLAAGTKVVSSGLWNQELLALRSTTPLRYYHRNTHTSAHAL